MKKLFILLALISFSVSTISFAAETAAKPAPVKKEKKTCHCQS